MQGMHWGLIYVIPGIEPRTFKELAICAHDIEISMANHGGNNPLVVEQRKDTKEVKKSDKSGKNFTKEFIVVTTIPIKILAKDKMEAIKKQY